MNQQSEQTTNIELDSEGKAWIKGANTKVVELVTEVPAYGWSDEELVHQRLPSWESWGTDLPRVGSLPEPYLRCG